jgi:DNA ligase-1
MLDDEYVVQDVEMGTATYNEGGSKVFNVASALLINHRGNTVRVGSGISKAQRLRWYKHPEEIVGKTITVQYFEETHDSKTGAVSLRFPVLKHVYENGRQM